MPRAHRSIRTYTWDGVWPEGHGTGHQEVEEDAQGPQVNRGPNVVIILQFKGTVSWDLEGNTLANWNQCTSIYFNMWIMRATVGLLNSRVIYELQESYIKKDNLKRKWHVKNMTFDHMRSFSLRPKQWTSSWFYMFPILWQNAKTLICHSLEWKPMFWFDRFCSISDSN